MLTVVETSAFARRAEKLLSTEEHDELLFFLALHPQSETRFQEPAEFVKCASQHASRENQAGCG